MKRLALIGGIGMMTMAGTNMIWHKQKLNQQPQKQIKQQSKQKTK